MQESLFEDKILFPRSYVNRSITERSGIKKNVLEKRNTGSPIQFVGYWGATGKEKIDAYDIITLTNLENYITGLRQIMSIERICILSDVHAIHNGYSEKKIYTYLAAVKDRLNRMDIDTIWLSDLYKRENLESRINLIYNNKIKYWENEKMSILLEQQAQKVSRNNYMKNHNACWYYCMRKTEAHLIEKIYKDAIFYSFSSDKIDELYPRLSKLYLWSQKRGVSKAPWLY